MVRGTDDNIRTIEDLADFLTKNYEDIFPPIEIGNRNEYSYRAQIMRRIVMLMNRARLGSK